eukprot:3646534-Rhodomonas_salina.4
MACRETAGYAMTVPDTAYWLVGRYLNLIEHLLPPHVLQLVQAGSSIAHISTGHCTVQPCSSMAYSSTGDRILNAYDISTGPDTA